MSYMLILLSIILVLLVINTVQVQRTETTLEFSKTIGRDNMYLTWKVEEMEKVFQYYVEYGKMPEFTPLDLS